MCLALLLKVIARRVTLNAVTNYSNRELVAFWLVNQACKQAKAAPIMRPLLTAYVI